MPKSKISLYFLGSDEFAVTVLKRLAEDPLFEVLGVVTPPDLPSGRKQILTPCPVKQFSIEHGLLVLDSPEALLDKTMDFVIVVSYGKILRQRILDLPAYASLNVHGSLLPKYRGASPVQSALLHGEKVTGVTVMKMVPKMDAGPIYSFSEVAIRPDHNAENLRAEMAKYGAELLAQTLPGIIEGSIESIEQAESKATYCSKIERSSGEIHWKKESALEIECKLKAYTPWPGIFTIWKGRRLKIHAGYAEKMPNHEHPSSSNLPGIVQKINEKVGVQTSQGIFYLESLQVEGKNKMSIEEFTRGFQDFLGSTVGS